MNRVVGKLAVWVLVLCTASGLDTAFAQEELVTPDPIPEPIQRSGLTIKLVDYVQVPINPEFYPPSRIVQLAHAGDASGRLFAVDMRGKIHVIHSGWLRDEPFLDVAELRGERFEQARLGRGLISLAFHPDFAQRNRAGFGRLYTLHTETGDGADDDIQVRVFPPPEGEIRRRAILTEWRVDPLNPNRVDPATRREVLQMGFRHSDHMAGFIAFNSNARPNGPDYGNLYLAIGDSGDTFLWTSRIDKDDTAQNLNTVAASILRIDPLPGAGRSYQVPNDNPFGREDAPGLAEIWAYGLRNPKWFTWDSGGDGAMLIVDIGQRHIEEINLGIKGANYGWSEREGTFVTNRDDQMELYRRDLDDRRHGFTYPVAQYDHDEGLAVSGGFVYRGRNVPELVGQYIFGDIVSGRIFHMDTSRLQPGWLNTIMEVTVVHNGRPTTILDMLGDVERADLRFGMDEAGELYVFTKQDGWIRRVESAMPASEASPVDRKSMGNMIWILGGATLFVVFGLVAFLKFRQPGNPQ